jgi:hypothetical protein
MSRGAGSPIATVRLGKHYADVALMEDHLRASGLDWTSVRLPLLTDKPPTGDYCAAYEQSGLFKRLIHVASSCVEWERSAWSLAASTLGRALRAWPDRRA